MEYFLPAAFQLWSWSALLSQDMRQTPSGSFQNGTTIVLSRDTTLSILPSTSQQSAGVRRIDDGSTGRHCGGIFLGEDVPNQEQIKDSFPASDN